MENDNLDMTLRNYIVYILGVFNIGLGIGGFIQGNILVPTINILVGIFLTYRSLKRLNYLKGD